MHLFTIKLLILLLLSHLIKQMRFKALMYFVTFKEYQSMLQYTSVQFFMKYLFLPDYLLRYLLYHTEEKHFFHFHLDQLFGKFKQLLTCFLFQLVGSKVHINVKSGSLK